jgi:hypothetical protein
MVGFGNFLNKLCIDKSKSEIPFETVKIIDSNGYINNGLGLNQRLSLNESQIFVIVRNFAIQNNPTCEIYIKTQVTDLDFEILMTLWTMNNGVKSIHIKMNKLIIRGMRY